MMTIRQVATVACWVAILGSFVLSFSTWLALGQLAGFGVLAVALPFCVDGYIVTALATWLTPGVSDRLARFARANTYGVGIVSTLSQAGYHGALIGSQGGAQAWRAVLAFVVGGLPLAVATLAVHIKARAVREPSTQPEPVPQPELAIAPTTAPSSPVQEPALPAARPEPRPATIAPTAWPHSVTAAVSASPAPAPVPVKEPVRVSAAPLPPPEEKSGTGPRTARPTVEDVRPLVAAGLGRSQIAQQLGIGTGTARALIEQARTEGNRLRSAS